VADSRHGSSHVEHPGFHWKADKSVTERNHGYEKIILEISERSWLSRQEANATSKNRKQRFSFASEEIIIVSILAKNDLD